MDTRIRCPQCRDLIDGSLQRHLEPGGECRGRSRKWPGLDYQCRALVAAMNEFPGIRTTESCCGHGERPFRVWFVADDLDALPALVYWTDPRHTGCYGWRVIALSDCARLPLKFRLEGPIGAFAEADMIAAKMREYIVKRGVD